MALCKNPFLIFVLLDQQIEIFRVQREVENSHLRNPVIELSASGEWRVRMRLLFLEVGDTEVVGQRAG